MSAAANWIEQAVTSGGTGNLILGASVNEGVTFTQAFGGDQTDILYSIQSAAGQRHIECGLCDYVDATNTITNRRPEATFNGSVYDTTSPSPVGISPGAIVTTPLTYQAYADMLTSLAAHKTSGDHDSRYLSINHPAQNVTDLGLSNEFLTAAGVYTTIPSPTAAEIKTAYESNADTNEFSDVEKLKLSTVENGATIDQSPAEIKTAYESNANTNAFTDAEQTKVSNALTSTGSIDTHTDVDTTTAAPINGQVLEWNGSNWVPATSGGGVTDHTLLSNIGTNTHAQIDTHIGDSTVHFTQGAISIPASQISDFDTEVANNTTVAAHTSKLAGIEDNATADQTAAEIKTAYESNADTNEFSDVEKLKLSTVENGATIDQSPAEIKSAYESNADTNAFTDAEQTKVANALTSTGSIDTHTDVDTTTAAPISGQVLEWDGNNWIPATSPAGVTDHTLLSNIGTNTHAQIDTHIGDSTVHFTQGNISVSASQISDFASEVDLVVSANSTVLVNASKVSAAGSIDVHSDVDTSTAAPTTGDTLEWDGVAWIPATPAGGITMYIQGTAPTGASDGDFWIDNS